MSMEGSWRIRELTISLYTMTLIGVIKDQVHTSAERTHLGWINMDVEFTI